MLLLVLKVIVLNSLAGPKSPLLFLYHNAITLVSQLFHMIFFCLLMLLQANFKIIHISFTIVEL